MKIFLSYKREQFNCAEYLTLCLRDKGYDVWFDVERLQQNMDWQEEIEAAITDADALVLLLSEQALGSQHVAVEWEQAQQQGTPVYGVIFEGVTIPPDLNLADTVDIRTDLDRNLDLLDASLQGREMAQHPVPPPYRLQLPHQQPLAMSLRFFEVLFNLIFSIVILIGLFNASTLIDLAAAGVDRVTIWTVNGGAILLGGITILSAPVGLYKRLKADAIVQDMSLRLRLFGSTLIYFFLFFPLVFVAIYWFDHLTAIGQVWLITSFLIGITGMIISIISLRFVRSESVFIRLPRDQHNILQRMRLRMHKRYGVEETFVAPQESAAFDAASIDECVAFHIYAMEADQPLADYAADLLIDAGHREVSADDAEHHLMIVSSHTTSLALAQWTQDSGTVGITPIITTPVDSSQLPEKVARAQWLHFHYKDLRAFGDKLAYIINHPSRLQNVMPKIPDNEHILGFRHTPIIDFVSGSEYYTSIHGIVIFGVTGFAMFQVMSDLSLSQITVNHVLAGLVYIALLFVAAFNAAGYIALQKRRFSLRQVLLYFDLPMAMIALLFVIFDIPYELMYGDRLLGDLRWLFALQLMFSLIINYGLLKHTLPLVPRQAHEDTVAVEWDDDFKKAAQQRITNSAGMLAPPMIIALDAPVISIVLYIIIFLGKWVYTQIRKPFRDELSDVGVVQT